MRIILTGFGGKTRNFFHTKLCYDIHYTTQKKNATLGLCSVPK